jgi:nitroreductase
MSTSSLQMSLQDALYGRRSVRSYSTEKLDKETIHVLLNAAVRAPTALHEEPWQFVVIQDTAFLKHLSDRAKKHVEEEAQRNSSEQRKHLLEIVSNPDFNIFYDASTLIAIVVKPLGDFVTADAWLAAENLLLAAYGLGLGTCVIGLAASVLNAMDVKKELGIPEEMLVVAPIIVGKPRGETPVSPRKEIEITVWKE